MVIIMLQQLLQIVVFLSFKVSAIVQDLDCNGINNTFTLNGTNVTFTCEVQTSSITWDIQPLDNQITFSAVNDPGDNTIIDGFTAIYVQAVPPGISSLNFILDLSLNETRVTCLDSGLAGNDMTCYVLVISVSDPPEGVTNISCTYSSVEIQWSSPSFNGGSDIIRYHITVEPPPSRIDTSCSGGECSSTDSNTLTYNITGLDYNQTYCLTVSAENIAGNSSVSELCVFVTANAPPAISTPPSLCINYDELILDVSWSSTMITDPKIPAVTSYTVCDDDDCSIVVNDCSCSTNLTLEFDEEYNIAVISNNIVGSSDKSPQDTLSTYLLTSITERDITNISALISYTTYSGCSDFPSNLEVLLSYSDCNETTTSVTMTNIYTTNRNDETFILTSLIPECVYQYTLQLYDVDEPFGMNITGMFTTQKDDPNDATSDDDDVSHSPILSSTRTSSTLTTEPTGMTESSSTAPLAAIVGGVVGGVTALLLVLICLIVIICCCCCFKNKNKKMRYEDEPFPLYYIPETGQYPTGDLYALPEKKGSRRQPSAPKETPTYQDPDTIKKQQAPTGYLYALPEKKPVYTQVNKKNKSQAAVYAELGF